MKKGLLTLFVAVVMVGIIMVPTRVHADSKTITDNQGIKYTLDDSTKTASISGHTENLSAQIVIPATVSHNGNIYTLTSIGEGAFEESGLSSVTFESGSKLETIEAGAFYNCQSLNLNMIPSKVTRIGESAFFSL